MNKHDKSPNRQDVSGPPTTQCKIELLFGGHSLWVQWSFPSAYNFLGAPCFLDVVLFSPFTFCREVSNKWAAELTGSFCSLTTSHAWRFVIVSFSSLVCSHFLYANINGNAAQFLADPVAGKSCDGRPQQPLPRRHCETGSGSSASFVRPTALFAFP